MDNNTKVTYIPKCPSCGKSFGRATQENYRFAINHVCPATEDMGYETRAERAAGDRYEGTED